MPWRCKPQAAARPAPSLFVISRQARAIGRAVTAADRARAARTRAAMGPTARGTSRRFGRSRGTTTRSRATPTPTARGTSTTSRAAGTTSGAARSCAPMRWSTTPGARGTSSSTTGAIAGGRCGPSKRAAACPASSTTCAPLVWGIARCDATDTETVGKRSHEATSSIALLGRTCASHPLPRSQAERRPNVGSLWALLRAAPSTERAARATLATGRHARSALARCFAPPERYRLEERPRACHTARPP